VRSGQAIEAARRDYRNAARKRQAQRTLPDAWAKLIESEDELLVELLSDKVEDLCGVKLSRQPRRSVQPVPSDAPKSTGYELYGQRHRARNARDVLVQVFRGFAERDPSFLERFAALPKHGRKRRYLARTREELYPGSPDLVGNAYEVRPG